MKKKPSQRELDFAYWWDIEHTPFREKWMLPKILKNGTTVKISYEDDMVARKKDYRRWEKVCDEVDKLREANDFDSKGLLSKEDEKNTLGFRLTHKDSIFYKQPHLIFIFPLGMKKNRNGMKGIIDKGVSLMEDQVGDIDLVEVEGIERKTAALVKTNRDKWGLPWKDQLTPEVERKGKIEAWKILRKSDEELGKIGFKTIGQVTKERDGRTRIDDKQRNRKMRALHWKISDKLKRNPLTQYKRFTLAKEKVLEKFGRSTSDDNYKKIVYQERNKSKSREMNVDN